MTNPVVCVNVTVVVDGFVLVVPVKLLRGVGESVDGLIAVDVVETTGGIVVPD